MSRSNERVATLKNMLGNINIESYADIGCGDGSITHSIAKELNIKDYYMYDVIPVNDPRYHKLEDIPTQSIQLVTCFVAIHHFQDPSYMFDQIKRILTDDGLLFIREHNIGTANNIYVYLELMHRMFPDPDYPCFFRSKRDLDEDLEVNGFDLINSSKYPEPNPQGIYHALYQLADRDSNSSFTTPITVNEASIMQWLRNFDNVKLATKLAASQSKKNYKDIMQYLSQCARNHEALRNIKAFLHN